MTREILDSLKGKTRPDEKVGLESLQKLYQGPIISSTKRFLLDDSNVCVLPIGPRCTGDPWGRTVCPASSVRRGPLETGCVSPCPRYVGTECVSPPISMRRGPLGTGSVSSPISVRRGPLGSGCVSPPISMRRGSLGTGSVSLPSDQRYLVSPPTTTYMGSSVFGSEEFETLGPEGKERKREGSITVTVSVSKESVHGNVGGGGVCRVPPPRGNSFYDRLRVCPTPRSTRPPTLCGSRRPSSQTGSVEYLTDTRVDRTVPGTHTGPLRRPVFNPGQDP